jgi:hypothetical protein
MQLLQLPAITIILIASSIACHHHHPDSFFNCLPSPSS